MMRSASDWCGNIAAFGVTIAFNVMSTSLPLGGQTMPEISAKYPSLFTPAGFTFSIWGVIYFGLTLFIIYQALPSQRHNASLGGLGVLFKVNCLANAAWLVAWHYDYLMLSVLIMACILFTLVRIYISLDSARTKAPDMEVMLVHLPFRLYTAWICVASIANVSVVQTAMGWDNIGMDSITWTLLKLALAGAIGAAVVARKADITFVLVIAWAAFGISVLQSNSLPVAGAALSLCMLSIMLAIFELIRRLCLKRFLR
jgi:hypothetical protein